MELIHSFLNLVAPPLSFFILLFFVPPFKFFKFFLSILSSIFSESVAGKVVVITGASSGIGEHMAYEYARRGACLAIAARRENRLHEVANLARELGSPDVITIRADVSRQEDCKRIIHETVNHYSQLDHLVNNAGINAVCMLEEVEDVNNLRPVMDVNFWGSTYTTRYAVPHLRNSRGRIIVLSSCACWLPLPRMSFYNASKAALAAFFETMRLEFGSDIKITIVTPGFIESELTQGKFCLQKEGRIVVDQTYRDVQIGPVPVATAESCARAIVSRACRGERYVTEPKWVKITQWWKLLCPEVVEWIFRIMYLTTTGDSPTETVSKKILDYTGARSVLYPETLQSPPEIKAD